MSKPSVLITGCSSGIGQALALKFHQQGFSVFATARKLETLASLAEQGIIAFSLDVNDTENIRSVIAQIEQQSGSLNVLVNNAGFAAMGPVVELTTEALNQQFATNVFAPMALARAALPLLQKAAEQKEAAQIVNIGSISGLVTTPFSGAYCATKSAIHSLSDALRMELKPFGIDVITVQPGAIQSKFGDNSLASLANLISPTSIYAPVKQHIEARATASQQNPTPACKFADVLVNKLTQTKVPSTIKIGNGSTLLPLLKKILPSKALDKILMKKFGLLQLK